MYQPSQTLRRATSSHHRQRKFPASSQLIVAEADLVALGQRLIRVARADMAASHNAFFIIPIDC
jgi:hypothetical protein